MILLQNLGNCDISAVSPIKINKCHSEKCYEQFDVRRVARPQDTQGTISSCNQGAIDRDSHSWFLVFCLASVQLVRCRESEWWELNSWGILSISGAASLAAAWNKVLAKTNWETAQKTTTTSPLISAKLWKTAGDPAPQPCHTVEVTSIYAHWSETKWLTESQWHHRVRPCR